MLNKQRCGESNPGGSSEKKVGDGKTYGEMKKTDGQTPMEYTPRNPKPYWEDPAGIVKWGD